MQIIRPMKGQNVFNLVSCLVGNCFVIIQSVGFFTKFRLKVLDLDHDYYFFDWKSKFILVDCPKCQFNNSTNQLQNFPLPPRINSFNSSTL